MREPAHETHVMVRTGLLRPSGLRQFFEVPYSNINDYLAAKSDCSIPNQTSGQTLRPSG